MTILITGANGFLGYYLIQQFLSPEFKIIATGRGESRLRHHQGNLTYVSMDFTDPFAVHDVFENHQPDVVVHGAAISNVDECERNQWQAYVTNVEGTLNLLSNAEEYKAHFIFISTDFVFDGDSGPFDEMSQANPVNFYGKTKRDAEDAVKEYPFDWAIVRTVLIYGNNHTGRDNILTGDNQKYLSFYPADESYRVTAKFEKAASPKWFKIATSGKEEKLYRVYGTVSFQMNETAIKLNLYQSQDLLKDPQYKDYIVLLFSDATTGKETYEAGRYIDFTTGDIKNNMIVIDFNKAYNPYCAYESGKYDCPIPPIENRVPVAIMAGEKIYDKPAK